MYEGPQEKPPDKELNDQMPFGGAPETVPADRAVNGRLLRIGLAAMESEASWKKFSSGWTGAPQVAVGDGAHGAKNAVEAVWPGRVLWVRCAYHWKKNLMTAVISDLVQLTGLASGSAKIQKDELLVLAGTVFTSTVAFLQFQGAAHRRFGTCTAFAKQPASTLKWCGGPPSSLPSSVRPAGSPARRSRP